MTAAIRRIDYSEEEFAPILAEAEGAGSSFMLRLRDEWVSGVQRFDGPGEFLLGAFLDGRLVGTGGLSRDPYDPQPELGRVRHLYVLTRLRGQGIGRALMETIIARARGEFRLLRLRTRAQAASALYESLGFVRSEAEGETHRLWLD